MNYWDQKNETMSRDELVNVQLEKLRKLVYKVNQNVPFYQKAFEQVGLTAGDLSSIDDLRHLPFTTKQDLRDNYPYGLFAVPMDEVVRVHASSGTTGKPTVVGYTKNDLSTWADLVARALTMAGTTKSDFVHNAFGYGFFTGGLGIHYGAERIGATIIPISAGNTDRQIMIMRDFGSTILTCTPSYALYLAETAEGMGMDSIHLKAGLFGAEPWTDQMRRQLEDKLGILALDIYGLSEVLGPGVGCECSEKAGLHIFEDHFIVEVIDPVTGTPLPDGEKGELVFTTLTKEALPVIRYRTRDISVIHREKCACGRTHARIERITGRTDDMLIIRGVNVFPSQIESVLLEFGETEPHYQLVVDRKDNLDSLEIWVELSANMFSDRVRFLEDLEARLRHRILSVLGISSRIKLVEPHTIPRSEGKAKRVVDRRDLF
ncbi:phenylacetate--CoA ligase family protein [Desulfolucanica intricata]|uniref:phenylacetate--CoA ligase family protein n=1 Tax=Desulfolucanica intricata TaxID=1285191 RepID=UPI00082D972B|nr:phenylacetate--CoA ligase [Desulfolucanica intricata]